MDSVRYFLALILLVSLPPLILFWVIIHPFVKFWRRLGPVWTYCIVGIIVGIGMIGVFLIRKLLLSTQFGTNYSFIFIGVLLLIIAGRLRFLLHKHVTNKLLAGLPELAPEQYPARLVTQGLYARIRHPRYIQFALALLGYALFTNYLAIYIIFVLWLFGIWIIAVLEERELRDRFGEEYEEYCRRVPRFIPKLAVRNMYKGGGDMGVI